MRQALHDSALLLPGQAQAVCAAPGPNWGRLAVMALAVGAVLFALAIRLALHQLVHQPNPSNRSRFRTVRVRRVLPLQPLGRRLSYPLSALDKLLSPMLIINMHFFYERRLDADKVAASLARLISRHPFLGGTVRGYLSWATLTCEDQGVELREQESDFTRADVYSGSGALQRQHHFWPNGFGSGRAYDVALAFIQYGAPALRVTITYLRDGSSALSVSVGHTIMDAKSIMKIIELWAADTRGEVSYYKHQEEDNGAPPPASPEGQGKGMVLVRSPSAGTGGAELLLSARELEELAAAWSPPCRLSLRQMWRFMVQATYQTSYMILMWLFGSLVTRTLFFSDDEVAALKKQVMADIRRRQEAEAASAQQQAQEQSLDESGASLGTSGSSTASVGYAARAPISSFVSTNDVLTAAWWKILSGLESVPMHLGGSTLRMNVDVRNLIAQPLVRTRLSSRDAPTPSSPAPHEAFVQTLPPSLDDSGTALKPPAPAAAAGEPEVAPHGSFFIGNGVLQVGAYHESPAQASVSDLAQAIRCAISGMTSEMACVRLGDLKQKIRHMDNLGILLGPLGCDYEMDRDVIISSFNPLHIDNDFGAGKAYFYDLDLLPPLMKYTHIHRGVDVYAGNKPGLFVQATLPHKCMAELLHKYPHLLPASPPPASAPGSPQEADEHDGALSGAQQHQQGHSHKDKEKDLPARLRLRQASGGQAAPSALSEGSGDEQGPGEQPSYGHSHSHKTADGVSLSPPSLPVWPRSAAS